MKLKDFNWKALALIGIAAGLLQVAAGVVMYLAGVYFASWSILVNLLVLLLCIVFGTRWYSARYLKAGVTYGQALVVGIFISVSTGIVYALYNIISISFFYPRFLDELLRTSTEQLPPDQQTPEAIALIRQTLTTNRIAVANLIRLSVVGSILSVFASLMLRTKRKVMN